MIRRLKTSTASIHAAAILIGGAGLMSRILGVLRNWLLARHFGAGRELDIYLTAFQIPDFMSVIFLLGAGTAAILPIFQDYLKKDREKAHELISGIYSTFLIGSLIGISLVFLFAPVIISIIVPGFSPAERELTATLTRIMLLSPVLLGLSSIISAVVQSFQRFTAYALAPIFYNVGIIVGILFFVPRWGLPGLGMGVVLGAFLHWLTQYSSISRIGFRPKLKFGRIPPAVLNVVRVSLPRVVSLSLNQLTLMVLVTLGSFLAAGSITVFELSQDLYFMPVGLFGVSYSVALFPRLSMAYINRSADEFFQELFFGIRTIVFWVAPFAALMLVLRAHAVRLSLGAGRFTWEDTRLTAASLGALAIAVTAGSLIPLLIKAYYALEDTWRPLFINLCSMAATLIVAWLTSSALSASAGQWGNGFGNALANLFRVADMPSRAVLGLAVGFGFGIIMDAIMLSIGLIALARRKFRSSLRVPYYELFKMAAAAVAAGFAAYGMRVSSAHTLPLLTFMQVLAQGLLAGIVGIGAYALTLTVLRSEDLFAVLSGMKARLVRIRVLPKYWGGDGIKEKQEL